MVGREFIIVLFFSNFSLMISKKDFTQLQRSLAREDQNILNATYATKTTYGMPTTISLMINE